jgi:UDP-N-acetylmuramyl pentapeptide phosphotransferase/UDP-N-acetylglucosamine-1-phosphate transferase
VSDLVPLLAAAAVAAALAPGVLRAFTENGWTRANHRGRALAFPGGAIAMAAAILALGALAAVDELWDTGILDPGGDLAADPGRAATLCLGVALLGALDDLLEAPPRGLRGHAAALLRGRPSTGALKAAGTLALAALVLRGHDDYVLAVAVLVLATNVFNLLDLRPGRAAKALLLLGVGLLAATQVTAPLRGVGAFAGGLLVLGAFDLRERTMLGDTGSGVLGAVAGAWLVSVLDTTGLLVALAILAAITAYGELRSISALVERITPLRALDRLGRPQDPPPRDLH